MNLEPIVQKELGQLPIPDLNVTIRTVSEVYPHCNRIKDSYFIQISIGSKLIDSTHDCSCSYLDFWYTPKEQLLEHINISLKENLKGKGFGRTLVETMDEIGRKLGCTTSKIQVNTNPSFWIHMGYEQKQEYWEKQI